MPNPTHMLNFKNNYFEVIAYHGKDKKYNAHTWKCKCKCGEIIILRTDVIKSEATKSCGCNRKPFFVKGHPFGKRFKPTHGLSKHPLYRKWSHIIERCYYTNPSHISYRYYKSKGIKVSEEWRNNFKAFYDWAINNGWKKGLVIDRIDSNGNYEPANCQFITPSENSRRMAKDNPNYGEYSSSAKLNDNAVKEIRILLEKKESTYKIAEKFNVSQKAIFNIKHGRSWKHLNP